MLGKRKGICNNLGKTGLPKFSIVIPSFNQGRFLEEALVSVINQNYPHTEIIVMDGGSTDESVEIIKKYERYIAHWVSEKDDGQSDALNKGFAVATGEVFGWMNADDKFMPGAFYKAAEVFCQHSAVGIVYGDCLRIDEAGHLLQVDYAFAFNVRHLKYEGFHIFTQAAFWKAKVHSRLGKLEENLHRIMDYDMFISFGTNETAESFFLLREPLGCFRRHTAQKTQGVFDEIDRTERWYVDAKWGIKRFGLSYYAWYAAYRLRRIYWYMRRGGPGYVYAKLRNKLNDMINRHRQLFLHFGS